MIANWWQRHVLPRDLHPGAWWLWAIGMAAAASRTTNPWLLLAIVAVVVHVVVARRSEAPWAMAFRLYLYLGLVIIAIRVFFRFVFGGDEGPTVILRLPELPLPAWAAGIRLFGDVSLESVLAGLYDGMRLATMIICLGAANALANPKRLLKAMPPALYEVGTVVVVALSVFPQLAESTLRVQRARRLRGDGLKRFHALRTIIIPVLEDALDRSLELAASMDSRGYGRTGSVGRGARFTTGLFMIAGLIGVTVGVYGTLDANTPRYLATPMLLGGVALAVVGFVVAGRRVQRTRYRPDRWRAPELLTAGSGIAVAAVMFTATGGNLAQLNPAMAVASWPTVAWGPLVGICIGLLPSFLTPPPASPFIGLEDEPDSEPDHESEPVR